MKKLFLKCSVLAILISAGVALAQDKVLLKTDLPKPQMVGTPCRYQRAEP